MADNNTPERNAESIEERRKRREEMRKRHKRRQMIFYGGILLVLALIIFLIVRGCTTGEAEPDPSSTPSSGTLQQLPTPDPNDPDLEQQSSDPDITEPANTSTVLLTAVGDVMIYDTQLAAALRTDGTYDFSSCFTDISRYTSAADLTVGTLETTLSGAEVGYQGKPNFNSPEVLTENLADIGFDVLSTASTFSLQNGVNGLISTIKNVRQASISNVGTYYTAEDRGKDGGALICDVGGIKIAILSYTKGANSIQVPSGYEYSINFLYKDYSTNYSEIDKSTILADIAAVKASDADVDIIIAMLHWGEEWTSTPNASQTEIANLMFENGVDIIIGSHSHVLQQIEKRTITTVDGVNKDVFVCYSLGNFIADQSNSYASDSIILNLELIRDNDTGNVTIGDYNYVPVYISGQTNGFRLFDINQSIADYNAGNRSYVTDELYSQLRDSLNNIHSLVGADRDRGVLTDYTASRSSGDVDITTNPTSTDGGGTEPTEPDPTTNGGDNPDEPVAQ